MEPLVKYIDHTLLKATATDEDIRNLCNEAITYSFYAVCVNSCYVPLAQKLLGESEVKVASVIGFPLGAMSTEAKLAEASYCIRNGANEIDMVINLGWFKSGNYDAVQEEIQMVKQQIGPGHILKVIIETCYLSPEEIDIACGLVVNAKADFIKTSTGFGTRGASLEDVRRMKKNIGSKIAIKASGGIRDKKTAMEYISLGVSRIGTSSGVAMMTK